MEQLDGEARDGERDHEDAGRDCGRGGGFCSGGGVAQHVGEELGGGGEYGVLVCELGHECFVAVFGGRESFEGVVEVVDEHGGWIAGLVGMGVI